MLVYNATVMSKDLIAKVCPQVSLTQNIEETTVLLCDTHPYKNVHNHIKHIICPCTNTNHIEPGAARVYSLEGKERFLKGIYATAHHTIYLILAQAYRGRFSRANPPRESLVGKVLGIIGYGRIGKQVANIAASFGMITLWYDIAFGSITLEEVLKQSDIITLHTSIKKGQQPIIGEEEFKLIKDGAWLINTSRGEAIDENALKNNMQRLGCFAADTLCGEPSPSSLEALSRYDNFTYTYHTGGYCLEDMRACYQFCIKEMLEEKC